MAPLVSRRFNLHFPYLPALLLLFSELAELILTSPRIRLLEASICRRHYLAYDPSVIAPDGSISEALCKLEDIQTRLAYIRGWQVVFEAIPVMALAVPWGALADRVGRKKVLAVNFVGCMMHICWFLLVCHPRSTMSAEWVWVSALAFALGGGPRTAGVLIMALVNDSSPSTERSERFYYTYSAFLVTELVAMPLAAFMMSQSILLPFAVALISLTFCFPILRVIRGVKPTIPALLQRSSSDEATVGLLDSSPDPERLELSSALQSTIFTNLCTTLAFLRPILTNSSILLVLLGHFLCPVRQELLFQILIPYTSHRFSLPIASAGLLLSVVAFANLVIFLFGLPLVTRYLRSLEFPASKIDAYTASYSSLILAVGSFFIGISTVFPMLVISTLVFAAGFGIRLGLLSLLTSMVEQEMVGRIYTLVTVVEGAGEMVSAPVLQGLWAWGLRMGDPWRGAPWWAAALVYVAGSWAIRNVRTVDTREG
ncbi:major facilitator superfamily domain-containing protein [Pyronema omphalodes]|nr:major facilitator superfamily domain-containing protein [Pyronema omphalodes]